MGKYIPTGGPAFPIECNIENGFRDDTGMTLRDWFAGQALASVPLRAWDHVGDSDEDRIKAWARCAYMAADAMLAEKFKADEMNAQERKDRGDDLPF